MNRVDVIQKLINENGYKIYLEIGTFRGYSFLPIRCKYKIAVDPDFQISRKKKWNWLMKNKYNWRNSYIKMTSDEFFQTRNFPRNKKPDIIFIDGLHTFENSLKDVLNSLRIMNDNGSIVLHDCFPPHRSAATPANSISEARAKTAVGWTGEWCGDVWKTIVYLKKKYPSYLDIFVLNTDYGIGILQVNNKEGLDFDINMDLFNVVSKLKFEKLQEDPQNLIGLKEVCS